MILLEILFKTANFLGVPKGANFWTSEDVFKILGCMLGSLEGFSVLKNVMVKLSSRRVDGIYKLRQVSRRQSHQAFFKVLSQHIRLLDVSKCSCVLRSDNHWNRSSTTDNTDQLFKSLQPRPDVVYTTKQGILVAPINCNREQEFSAFNLSSERTDRYFWLTKLRVLLKILCSL